MFGLDLLFSVGNIVLFMAIFTRLSGLFISAPLISTYPIPPQVKIWLAATIAFILFPIVQYNTTFTTPTNVPAQTTSNTTIEIIAVLFFSKFILFLPPNILITYNLLHFYTGIRITKKRQKVKHFFECLQLLSQ